ncbi:MAG: hypothetical protein R3C14_11500 [Caldilineaceae bacterium]
MINTQSDYRFDPIDFVEMRPWALLAPTQRLETMLNARELAVGLIRGQMSKRYPALSWAELNLKVLQEIVESTAKTGFFRKFAEIPRENSAQKPGFLAFCSRVIV